MTMDWETQFNPRKAVPTAETYAAASRAKSDLAHARFADIETMRYGDSPLSNLNFRRARTPGRPLLVFVHGGYWRGRDKDDFGFLFEAMDAADINVAILNYDLCPQVTVRQICQQIQSAFVWLHAQAQSLGFDASRIDAAGHSAGAHLIAMTLAREPAAFCLEEGLIRNAYLISGIYELSPVLNISVNQEIRLKAEEVTDLSPIRFAPASQTHYEVIVGGGEPRGWQDQSIAFERHIRDQGADSHLTILPERHHYSILQDLETPDAELSKRLIQNFEG